MPRTLLASLTAALLAALAVASTVYPADAHGRSHQPSTAQLADAVPANASTTAITDSEAQRLVWALPEVQRSAAELRQQGVRPFTMVESTPDPAARPGTETAAYLIYFGEDQGDHVVRVDSYLVDGYTGRVSRLDPMALEAAFVP